MSKGVPIEEYRFRILLDHASKFGALMGGIQWYGPALSDTLPQSNLLHGEFWHSTADFHDSLQEMRDYCRKHPDNHGLDHAHVYALDGRGGAMKFHAYLWTPIMGDAMQPLDYGRAVDPHNRAYSSCILETFLAQKKAVKTSTVVKRALPLALQRLGAGVSEETHNVLLHKALTVMMNTEPLVFTRRFDSDHSPSGQFTMVEHLGIYDKEPTWLL